ncbi:MAG: hypothetical protein R2800_02155 [Flavipsychrobacter sp.]
MNKSKYLLFIPLFIFSACIDVQQKQPKNNKKSAGYFSIKDYIKDQWNTYRGQPFGIIKVVSMNDKVDTVYTNAFDIELGKLMDIFIETDISDAKYLGQYEFSNFGDYPTMSVNYFYEAKSPDLYTRRLQISADDLTKVVKSIYIETEKQTRLNVIQQKLTYQPTKRISIYELENSKVGPQKEVKIDYIFL